MVILLFGPPGCGKGTQSPLITKMLSIPAISTGEMLRAEVTAGTPLGIEAAQVLASGKLVSDEVVNRMLETRIAQPDCRRGFLLDGYPRKVTQAIFLESLIAGHGFAPPAVIHLTTPTHGLIERISNRRQCPVCGRIYNLLFMPPVKPGVCDIDGARLIRRKDDTADVVEQRLTEYDEQTKPVMDFYAAGGHGCYYAVNANRPSSEVFRDVEAALRSAERRHLLLESGAHQPHAKA